MEYDEHPTDPHHGGKMTAAHMADYIRELETAALAALYYISDGAHGKNPMQDRPMDKDAAFDIICNTLRLER